MWRGVVAAVTAALVSAVGAPAADAAVAQSGATFAGSSWFVTDVGRTRAGLLQSDGTVAGTKVVATLRSGSSPYCRSCTYSVAATADRLVVTEREQEVYSRPHLRVWTTDGSGRLKPALREVLRRHPDPTVVPGRTSTLVHYSAWPREGTELARAAGPDLTDVAVVGRFPDVGRVVDAPDGSWFVSAPEASGPGTLWRITPAGERIRLGPTAPGAGPIMTFAEGRLWFRGFDTEHGSEPWSTDGTAAGTRLLTDATPGRKSTSIFGEGVVAGGRWYLAMSYASSLPRPTYVVSPGSSALIGGGPTAFGAAFALNGDVFGWGAGGLSKLTGAQLDLLPLGAPTSVQSPDFGPIAHGGRIYWTDEHILWGTDGTTAGTTAVAPLAFGRQYKGAGDPPVEWGASLTGGLFLVGAVEGADTLELWRTDGTAAGTVILTPPGRFAAARPSATVFVRRDPGSGPRRRLELTGEVVFAPSSPAATLCSGTVRIELRTVGPKKVRWRGSAARTNWTGEACTFAVEAPTGSGAARSHEVLAHVAFTPDSAQSWPAESDPVTVKRR